MIVVRIETILFYEVLMAMYKLKLTRISVGLDGLPPLFFTRIKYSIRGRLVFLTMHFIILHLHLHYLKVLLAHTVFVISHQTRSQNVLASSMKIIKRTGGGPECATLAK